MRLLDIPSSPRGESSDSIALTKSFIAACKPKRNSVVVDTLNVWHERLPDFDCDAIGAKYKAIKHETMTAARIRSLILPFQNADRIVIGTPMWHFGLPYKLKHFIDLVALFAYDGKQYGPLLNVKRQSLCKHAAHGSWRAVPFRPRNSITRRPIWTFGRSL
jgi:FMN-dependent NADH-azoreductase